MSYVIRPMELEDIPEVTEIDRLCYTMTWPASAYRRELRDNKLSRYIVAQWVNSESEPEKDEALVQAESRPGGPQANRSLVRRALGYLLQGIYPAPRARGVTSLAGYAGLWLMLDEAHVTTIAVRPNVRGQGIGELLFVGLIDLSIGLGAKNVTLEVRVSNQVAQNLYRKYGFREEGVRKRYYSDNGEDALIMWSEDLHSPQFMHRMHELKEQLSQRLDQMMPPWYQSERGLEAAK